MAIDRPGHWTYTGDPTASSKDAVRVLCGDIDDTDPQVTDEEIAFWLAEEGNSYSAAAAVCEHLAARWAREASRSISVGGGTSTSINLSDRARAYETKAAKLRLRAATSAGMVYAGGISIADKEDNEANTDRVQPSFRHGMFDNPDAA